MTIMQRGSELAIRFVAPKDARQRPRLTWLLNKNSKPHPVAHFATRVGHPRNARLRTGHTEINSVRPRSQKRGFALVLRGLACGRPPRHGGGSRPCGIIA